MLSIESTERLTGGRISGDYWDLDELITSIYEVIGDENKYYDYQGARQRILGVCLQLRKATKGECNIEFVANGIHKGIEKRKDLIAPAKNVYFSVEILWPELIFTALALNDFIDLYNEFVDNNPWNPHTTTIRKFQSIVTECLREHLLEEQFRVFIHLMFTKSPKYFRYATQYVDVLNLEYLKLSYDERKENLGAFAFRLMVEDDEYTALKNEIMATAKLTKNEIHELPIQTKYPEHIEW
ncbi:hypothetical protein NST62_13540 [Ureibacillus sp. FSL K6-8385]|uniref:Uncharacterized protein n=1 Tax=Ureibacillus terrenus TaxID=118246 RepID=A0A540V2R7_9BACL|nr:hypothetical protein [Ureibacillus terrenus]MED3661666.1 hypothetical protein [Ureibacillus terrenus]MED3763553.1 hypothetical protein [Ureibacillus terrenus]TQE91042.1 hypothetical protein FKZ59_06925 [Ureibacillus terrenus]